MKFVTFAAACALLAAPAVGQSVGDKAKDVGEKTGVNSVVGVSPTTADFVTRAAISDMFEIKSSQLAADRSDQATKAFATQMIADHQKTSKELKDLSATGSFVLPPDVDSSHRKMLDKLGEKTGDKFTKAYHKDQVSAHKTAVSLFMRYAKNGDDPTLKAWAAKTLPTLQQHLQMAKDLDK